MKMGKGIKGKEIYWNSPQNVLLRIKVLFQISISLFRFYHEISMEINQKALAMTSFDNGDIVWIMILTSRW